MSGLARRAVQARAKPAERGIWNDLHRNMERLGDFARLWRSALPRDVMKLFRCQVCDNIIGGPSLPQRFDTAWPVDSAASRSTS